MADLERVFAFGEREVCFVRNTEMEVNPALPFAIGGQAILPKHYWEERDITKTTVEPPLGSGPYRLKRVETGRLLEFELDENYWGRNLPVNKGRYNFKTVKFDYFKDDGVMLEAHKGNVFDVREEGVSKNWATQYDFPAVRAGLFKRDSAQADAGGGALVAHLLEQRKASLERHPRARSPVAALRLRLDQPGPVLQLLPERREPVPELADGAQRAA